MTSTIKQHNNSFCSNESSEYELNTDTLDELYKAQLQILRDLIFKQSQCNDIELCRKWLKIFAKTTTSEKLARNCLCSLMQQQLQECGCLSEPFTSLQNCNRNLEHVLRELDNQNTVCENYDETVATFMSHQRHNMSSNRDTQQCNDDTLIECQANESKVENVQLRHELQMMRLQLAEKQIENIKLKEIAEKYQLKTAYAPLNNYESFKQIILTSTEKSLQRLATEVEFPFGIFQELCSNFSEDREFNNCLKNYDDIFKELLSKIFAKQLKKREAIAVCQRLKKNKKKLRTIYEHRLRVQNWAQRLQLKLVKLKCFSVLRQIILNTQQNEAEMWQMLGEFEKKYQDIVDEIL